MKVLAAVVTHNRAFLLDRCINKIPDQTSLPDQVIVINKRCTDDTNMVLDRYPVEKIEQENLGSAGGWNSAITFCLEKDYDFIWLMDDDGYPDKNALNVLCNQFEDKFSCLSSVIVDENNHNQFVFPYPLIKKNGVPNTLKFWKKYNSINALPLSDNFYYPYAHLFNGALIRVESIKRIGNVDIGYFMYGDEVDFNFRLLSDGIVASTPMAKHFHPNVMEREYSLLRIYYNMKNNLINYRKHYDKPLLRSILGPLVILLRVSRANGLLYAFSLIVGKNKKIFFKSINRGFQEKLGKDFPH